MRASARQLTPNAFAAQFALDTANTVSEVMVTALACIWSAADRLRSQAEVKQHDADPGQHA